MPDAGTAVIENKRGWKVHEQAIEDQHHARHSIEVSDNIWKEAKAKKNQNWDFPAANINTGKVHDKSVVKGAAPTKSEETKTAPAEAKAEEPTKDAPAKEEPKAAPEKTEKSKEPEAKSETPKEAKAEPAKEAKTSVKDETPKEEKA